MSFRHWATRFQSIQVRGRARVAVLHPIPIMLASARHPRTAAANKNTNAIYMPTIRGLDARNSCDLTHLRQSQARSSARGDGRASPQVQMYSRKAWLLKPRSTTTHFGTPGKRSRSGMACGSSWAWPGARMKATARPSPSAITQALVPYPPRERPSASRVSRSAGVTLFGRPGRLLVGPDVVPSRNVIPSWIPRSWARRSSRSQTPRRAQRMKV